jgi:RNA polymerase sigma factor (sigma-70 family)
MGIDGLELAVAEYIDWFNHHRLHGEIGLVPPAEFEEAYHRHNPAPTTVGASAPSLHRPRGETPDAGVLVSRALTSVRRVSSSFTRCSAFGVGASSDGPHEELRMLNDDGPHEQDAVIRERRRLMSLAYRMTGTLEDAEDIVQETYIRWYRLSEQERDGIRVPAAWLTRVASRVALDVLKSARARRERQVGQWLPEPVPADLFVGTAVGSKGTAPGTEDPLDRVTLDDAVSTALLVVLESMTPPERVAFVLHDVFGAPFDEIAELVGRSAAATRQLAASARRRVREQRTETVPAEQHDEVVRTFLAASRGGDIRLLMQTLAPEVELRADGGGAVRVAPNVVAGADHVARFLLGVMQKQPGLVFEERYTADGLGYALTLAGQFFGIMSFHVEAAGISDVWLVLDPHKLGGWLPSATWRE